MSHLSRSRVVAAAGLTLGTAAIGLVSGLPVASAAPAPLPIPVLSHSTVEPGQWFTLTLSGCFQDGGGDALASAFFSSTDDDPELTNGAQIPAGGSYTFTSERFSPNSPLGTYTIQATCDRYHDNQPYPPVTITLVAPDPSAPTTGLTGFSPHAPTAEDVVLGAVKGAAANTPGIFEKSTPVPASALVPGRRVTKVLGGFQPFEVVTLVMHSTPTTLGTFTADADGVLTATYTIPAGTPAAQHTFVFDGDQGSYYQEVAHVGSVTAVATAGDSLAYTGASVAVPLAVGGALVTAGAGALRFARRRDAAAQG